MPTRAMVAGFVEKKGGNVRDIVFNKTCNDLNEIQQAVEDAVDMNATTIIIKRIMPVGKGRGY